MRPRHRAIDGCDRRSHVRERGQVAGIEVLPFGFLVFVAGILLVVNAWAVVDAKLAVTVAAREAARAYVEAPDAWSAHNAAQRRAVEAMHAHGRGDPSRVRVQVSVPQGHGRCRPVVVTVSYTTPALVVPFTGGFGRSLTASSTHTELVDPYRDGLAESRCST
jgi:hypothetical protein